MLTSVYSPVRSRRRYPLLDAWRGFALINMIAYHAMWDLVYLAGVDAPWYLSRGAFYWQQFICWSLILLSGFCWSMSRHPVRHGLITFGAGMLVTVVTLLFLPDATIWWGVLTFLGAAALALYALHPLVKRGSAWLGLAASAVLFAVTYHVPDGTLAGGVILPERLYQFGHLSAFLGFAPAQFSSGDYFPLIPWLFLFLVGYYLYRLWRWSDEIIPLGGRDIPILGWMGRHSLAIYLAHQPVLYVMVLILNLVRK